MTFTDLIEHSFTPVNTGLSIAVILSVIYWIFTIITGMGDDLGIDFGKDIDIDKDIDLNEDISFDKNIHHPDGAMDVPHEPSAFIQFLKFLNLDVIPITFFLTLATLFTWFFSVNASFLLGPPTWLAFILAFPAFFASLFITKFITWPFRGIFTVINHKGERPYDFLGREGVLKSNLQGDRMGMLEVMVGKDPIKLLAKTKDGSPLAEGTFVVIEDESPDKKFYFVKAMAED